jgi:hypothetical protein
MVMLPKIKYLSLSSAGRRIRLVGGLFLSLSLLPSAHAANEIVINEIMYNSDGTDVEYVELYNNSETTYDLQNWYILDNNSDHEPCIINWTLQPDEYLIIAGNITLFKLKYPGVLLINPNGFDTGGMGWALGNEGDAVRLYDNTHTLHDQVDYDDGGDWPASPDGGGPSLELLHPALDNSLPTSWDPSSSDNGTPGEKNSVFTTNVSPTCKDGERSISLPTSSDQVMISVLAFDNEGLEKVELYLNTGQGFFNKMMYDNGINGDDVAGDSLYSAIIPAQNSGNLVKYYAKATDNIGQEDKWPNNAPLEYHAYTVDYEPPRLRITELLAVNDKVNADEFGEYDDWFEIHNAGAENVNLGGMYVSNSLVSSKSFKLPQLNIAPDEYILFWADNDTEQGARHVNFKFASDGEEIALFETVDHGNVLIHGWKYGLMSSDVSMGFKPEIGTAPEYLTTPTPEASNESSDYFSPICINEFQATSDFGGPDDWVEIYNRGNESFDLSGCFLSDQRSNNTKWAFPPGTLLAPSEFLVVYEDALGFGFSSEGKDVIMLTASDSTTGLDFYDFKEQHADRSEGRFPDGINNWQLFDTPTRGEPNSGSSGAHDNDIEIPNEYILYQNHPNPFNSKTVISYQLKVTRHTDLSIYNALGQKITTLVSEKQEAGYHTVEWDARNASSGVYFYKIKAGEFSQLRKMILVK